MPFVTPGQNFNRLLCSPIALIVIDPFTSTVTAITALLFEASFTVIITVPTFTEVIAILPALIVAVATVLSEDDTLIPVNPRVAISFNIESFVVALKLFSSYPSLSLGL
ncbi:hypothetical protein [Metabacillus fastidiosus]|uniref:hypothetical protein n=1 Tax=Metabacillus fastidiosus TaxID=1458 RepID=UPI003D2C3E2E